MAAAICATTASATSGRAGTMDRICAAAGNDMIVPAPLVDNCTSCHNNGSGGGSGAGRDVYRDGTDAERLAFFCPAVTPPPPPPQPQPVDNDGDGYVDNVDCNDNNIAINPGAQEDCTDNVDNNCNGLIDNQDPAAVNCPVACIDNDGDGYNAEGEGCGVPDCDDNNDAIHPNAFESCGGTVDNNCNGVTGAEDGLCTAPADPMQELLDQIAELQSQLAECQAGTPPVDDTPPPVDESDDESDGDSHSHSDRRSRRNRD
jgi:hypothetical protein